MRSTWLLLEADLVKYYDKNSSIQAKQFVQQQNMTGDVRIKADLPFMLQVIVNYLKTDGTDESHYSTIFCLQPESFMSPSQLCLRREKQL